MQKQDVFNHDDRKAEWTPIYNMYLLFPEKGERPNAKKISEKLSETLGRVDVVSDSKSENDDKSFSTFALLDHMVSYENNTKSMPAQLLIADYEHTDILEKLTPFELSQQWFCPEYKEIIESTKYTLMITDFMAAGLPNVERIEILTNFVETAIELFPDCIGVFFKPCDVLLSSKAICENKKRPGLRGLNLFMNIRFFNIQGTDNEMVVDSYGLYKFDLPDIQYHFHSLTPSDVVNHCFNVAAYIFNGAEIKDGETIDGLNNGKISRDVYWKCQYELSLIQPEREVLDINTLEFAAGQRNNNTEKRNNKKNKY